MINPEQMLGSMLFSGLGGKAGKKLNKKLRKGMGGMGGIGGGMLGMGALGVAIAAFDHFVVDKKRNQAGVQGGFAQQQPQINHPGAPPSTPPPPPPGQSQAAAPPPVEPTQPTVPVEVPDTPAAHQALLLIKAMIAAANADGAIDANERNQIVGRLEQAGLSGEDRGFILNEFLNPPTMIDIVGAVNSPDLAKQVYAVSLFAIEVDTEAEKNYMELLALKLSLSEQDVQQIENELGLNEA
ncbi:MAG: tellurite resistance TerB family protein [Candidatus Hinthialibacter antarcticus]|nr:tellurite resistance TerB family protein [Candidatus Hinthialibacter antarcticus]